MEHNKKEGNDDVSGTRALFDARHNDLGICWIALWVSFPVGLGLVAFIGVMKLQETITDWRPSDLFLNPLGPKRKSAAAR